MKHSLTAVKQITIIDKSVWLVVHRLRGAGACHLRTAGFRVYLASFDVTDWCDVGDGQKSTKRRTLPCGIPEMQLTVDDRRQPS